MSPVMLEQTEIASGCRILFVVGEMVAGGVEKQICHLLEAMDRERYCPMLAIWNHDETDVNMPAVRALGIPVWGHPASVSSYRKLLDLTRLARRLRPEVVHSYSFYTNFAAACTAWASSAIGIGSIQGESDMIELTASHPVLGRLSAVLPRNQLSNSEAAAMRMMLRSDWVKPKRLSVVRNGLPEGSFECSPVPLGEPHRILGIGSLLPVKRWDRLVRLGYELKTRGVNCVIQIAGDGPEREHLQSLASSLGVLGMVDLLGYRRDVSDLIGRARMVVHTSDAEGTPNAVIEALAAGRPVVATGVGDVPDLIRQGTTGFVVSPDDPDELVRRVLEVVSDDRLAAEMGRSARSHAVREFSLSRLVAETFDVYRAAGWMDGA